MVIFALVIILLASQIIHGTEENPEWAKTSLDEIEMRVAMIASFVSLGNEMKTPNIERQSKHWQALPSQFTGQS